MFIRASIQKKKPRTEYKTFKLVESFRTERGPRQRTVLNLGADFDLPEAQWKDLANRDIPGTSYLILPVIHKLSISMKMHDFKSLLIIEA